MERPTQSSEYQVPHLDPAEVKRLIKALPAHLRTWATFTWMMALRITESFSIEWRDIDVAGKHLTVRAEIDKAGQTWTLPLDEAAPVLARIERGAPRERIFTASRSDRGALGEAAKALGLPHVTAHHLRHARITEWAHGSKELASVQFMARHTNIATTGLYVRSGTAQAARMLREVRRGRQ
jgi:integrase